MRAAWRTVGTKKKQLLDVLGDESQSEDVYRLHWVDVSLKLDIDQLDLDIVMC